VVRNVLKLPVGLVNPLPPAARSQMLVGTFFKQLRVSALREAQFPAALFDA
jgi:hypothetical protein